MNDIASPPAATPGANFKMNILLVDDQPIVAAAVKQGVAGIPDLEFHYCSDPLVAAATAGRLQPTVILQDLVMPQKDGLALVREYRAQPATADTPIIMLSTREEAQLKSDAFAAGANDYVVKLPDQLELLARLRYHSKVYWNRVQRDEAFTALRENQRQLLDKNAFLIRTHEELTEALAKIKKLHGMLPICCVCKKIRNDQNYWQSIEGYMQEHAGMNLAQSLCPDCVQKALSTAKEGRPPGPA
ncbi:MAG TPA: response regulator [Candidatus Acidoferrales bacterium]|jgi:PleD family two-component response regulator|nr:response regulator [Candidatus Acidoferrales bacterium]